MKKKLYFLSILAAGLTLAGCNDDLGDGPGNDIQSGDKGYVKIAINLPTTSGQVTRSVNDKFDDGLQEEYAVKNAIVVFFKGGKNPADVSNATLAKAVEINLVDDPWNTVEPSTDNNITTKKSFTIKGVPTVEANEQMYAFVILNNNGLFSADNVNISSYTDLLNMSYTMDEETDASKFTGDGFLMCNAPISNIPSSVEGTSFNPEVTILAPVRVHEEDPSEIDNIAADPIYVERAVAKVEVSVAGVKNVDGTVSLPVTDVTGHSIKFKQWALNVTNKSSYILRHVADDYETTWATYYNEKANGGSGAPNRFFGTAPDPYRVYWAVDMNYIDNDASYFNQFNTVEPHWKRMLKEDGMTTNVDYCFENTMVAKQQIQGFTTGVLLEGEYAIDGMTGIDLFTLGSSSAVYTKDGMLGYINTVLATASSPNTYEFNADQPGATIDTEAEFAQYFKTSAGTPMTSEDAQKLIKDPNVAQINYYKGGKTYYWTRPIKHFGDYYTPIYKGDTQVDYYDSADDYDNDNHLGRYGVVRNNWYELNITSVSGPGYPEIPEIPTEPENPDDPGEGYVKMEINILSWAKREQDVEL